MATYNKFQSFVEALAEKVHNLGSDQLVVGLTTNANAPSASLDAVRADITEIAYTNLSSRNITTSSSAQSAGTYKLVLTDLVLTASGAVATFRWVFIYNDTATNDELISFFDYGADLTLANGETFTIDFDGTNGLLQIA
jgi:hypothetical protein